MDLKTFGENDFDPKKWINKSWATSGTQDKELFVNNTVSRLQLHMKQLSNLLDETTTQLVASIPRILSESSSVSALGASLSEGVSALQKKVEQVESDTGHSIQTLQKIDDLKSRLENAASKLRESDKWAQLAVILEDILDNGVPTQGDKLNELTAQVVAMTASLQVLSEAPDYESKQTQLESLYNRLEAALTPAVITALTQKNAENTAAFEAIFSAMNRHTSLIRYWRRVQAELLQQATRDEQNPHHRISDLLAHANLQMDWLNNVLKSKTPLNELIRLYTDLLLSLDPSPVKMLSANLKLCSSPEEAINVLIDHKQDVDNFITNFKIILQTERPNKEYILPAALKELGRAIYAPLRDALPKYTDLQAIILTSYLSTKNLDNNDLAEKSRFLTSIVDRCESWFLTAHTQARKIAGNAVYPFFIPAVEAFISAFNSLCSNLSRELEAWFQSSPSPPGVLWGGFPPAAAGGSAAGAMPHRIRKLAQTCLTQQESTESDPLLSLETLILDEAGREFLSGLFSGTEVPWTVSIDDTNRCAKTLRTLSLTIVTDPIAVQLDKIPTLPVWDNNNALSTDLPDFSISPQEYITVAGQYLMTLPQHLELHLSEKDAPWQFLNEVCNRSCEMYAEKINIIQNMDALGTKRCLTDIVYLSSVLEDLGTTITPSLKNLENSLRNSINTMEQNNSL